MHIFEMSQLKLCTLDRKSWDQTADVAEHGSADAWSSRLRRGCEAKAFRIQSVCGSASACVNGWRGAEQMWHLWWRGVHHVDPGWQDNFHHETFVTYVRSNHRSLFGLPPFKIQGEPIQSYLHCCTFLMPRARFFDSPIRIQLPGFASCAPAPTSRVTQSTRSSQDASGVTQFEMRVTKTKEQCAFTACECTKAGTSCRSGWNL